MVPHLDRVISASLGEAIEARLAAVLGDADEVIVIRELNARIALSGLDLSLDRRVLDRMSAASVDAIAATLARPPDDELVVRFADQAEFVGSFIVDVIAGTAWDRWYFGAFHRHRQADTAATIAEVLDKNRDWVAAIFGWLQRRGSLDAVLALLGEERARELSDAGAAVQERASSDDDVRPLAWAAMALMEALGWDPGGVAEREALERDYLTGDPMPPAWSDRQALTAWVLRFVRFGVARLEAVGSRRAPFDPAAAGVLLRGPLDWLDVESLEPQLGDEAPGAASIHPAGEALSAVLAASHERALERLAELVRGGSVRIGRHESRDAVIVRLLAAIGDVRMGDLDSRGLARAVERVATAFRSAMDGHVDLERIAAALGSASGASHALPRGQGVLAAALDGVREAGPAAALLLQNLAKANAGEPLGLATSAAGLYLLTRALIDVRLDGLARDAGVLFGPLKGALASWWLDLVPPFDEPARLWVGADGEEDQHALSGLAPRLSALEEALFERLCGQRALKARPDDSLFDDDEGRPFGSIPLEPAARASAARIGWMLLRAWSRWLPGVAGSGRGFLVSRCLLRAGRASVTDREVALTVEPAPLDVVLEMAGYFAPIDQVPWLGGRSITFGVRRVRG
jgi:hypothetical protein